MFGGAFFGKTYWGGTYWGPAGGVVPPDPEPIQQSTGAGGGSYRKGERRKRGLEWDKRDTAQDIEGWLRDAYAELTGENQVEAVAETVAEVVAPFKEPDVEAVNWAALAVNAEAIKRLAEIYERHVQAIEVERLRRIDEEEAAFMLLMQ